MAMLPKIWLQNWSFPKKPTGRLFSAMALPRSWEHGAGRVSMVAPSPLDLRAVQAGQLAIDQYFHRYSHQLEAKQLNPSQLVAENGVQIEDGDGLCCSCAARSLPARSLFGGTLEAKRAHPCHLEVLAPRLVQAGWAVALYGHELCRAPDGRFLWGGIPWVSPLSQACSV